MEVLKAHRKVFGYWIYDFKGISPTIASIEYSWKKEFNWLLLFK
jgi:hypothetical protein